MKPEYLLFSIIGYSIQISLLVGTAVLAAFLNRKKSPGTALWFWQGVLGLVLFLPLIEALPAPSATFLEPVWKFEINAVSSPAHNPGSGFPWALLLISILFAGAVFNLGKFCLGLVRLRTLPRRAILLDPLPEHLLCMMQRLHGKCHIRISDEVSNPVTFGLLNPVILVPEKFLGLDQSQQECIACHELLHVSRRDWLLNLSEQLVKSLLWFHPAVHFLVREINLAREELVDARVVGITGKRQVYLKALWEMVQPGAGVNAFPVVPFAGRSQLLKRVRLLSKEVEMSKKQTILAATGLLILAFSTIAFGQNVFPIHPNHLLSINAVPTLAVPVAENEGSISISDEPVDLTNTDTRPQLIKKVNPEYPPEAKEARIVGTVICKALIDKEGNVKGITIVESPNELLSQSAVEAVKQWKYAPVLQNGEPVEVIFTVTINYTLKD